MKLEIANTLGIRKAAVELTPGQIVEVVGPNASGKTSVAVCAQAVLAMTGNPYSLSAADAKRHYPHGGADDARVDLEDDTGADVTWFVNSGRIQAPDMAPPCVPEAVGLVDFTAKRSAKERAAMFQGILLPPMELVVDEVKTHLERYLPEDDLSAVLDYLSKRGWDATASIYQDRGKSAKGSWRNLTGRNYGVRVAADWKPDGWLAPYDVLTVQQAEAAVTDARDELATLHRVQAVSEAEAELAEGAAMAMPGYEGQVESLMKDVGRLRKEQEAIPLEAARRAVAKLEDDLARAKRNKRNVQACPHCGGDLLVRADATIVDGVGANSDGDHEIGMLVHKLEDARAELSQREADRKPIVEELHAKTAALREAQQTLAVAQSQVKRGGPVETEEHRTALAEAEQEVENAKEVVRLVKAERDAAQLHETITRYTEIAKALGPEGVRAKMLDKGLRRLNKGLEIIRDTARWPEVMVAPNGAISVNDRPVQLCSESERWRAQASIQLTLAALAGSKAVVLDRADMLDTDNRIGLIRALARVADKTRLAVMVCATNNGQIDEDMKYTGPNAWSHVILHNGEAL